MTEIQELLDYINASVDWYPIRDKVIEVAPSVFPDPIVQYDPIPVAHIAYYPFCDCGEPVLVLRVPMCKEITMYGYGYMETCYECGVVSSD